MQAGESPLWKVVTDRVGSALLLIVAAIPMLTIGLVIRWDLGPPVLMRQRRIGQHGVEYSMWKFRTLPRDTPQVAKSELGVSGIQTTAVGHFLRRYSLDELPQLFNVLAGEMSLVGPRPALFTQDDLVRMRAQAGVLTAKPGLTGLAQINGREHLTLSEKVALDAEYVRRMSLSLDIQIVLRTVQAVLRPRGSY
jgi:O-antigen biosynthesis protein WbqP